MPKPPHSRNGGGMLEYIKHTPKLATADKRLGPILYPQSPNCNRLPRLRGANGPSPEATPEDPGNEPLGFLIFRTGMQPPVAKLLQQKLGQQKIDNQPALAERIS